MKRHEWASWAMALEVPSGPAHVALVLAQHANAEGVCWPGTARLAAATKMGRTALYQHLRALRKAGALEVVPLPPEAQQGRRRGPPPKAFRLTGNRVGIRHDQPEKPCRNPDEIVSESDTASVGIRHQPAPTPLTRTASERSGNDHHPHPQHAREEGAPGQRPGDGGGEGTTLSAPGTPTPAQAELAEAVKRFRGLFERAPTKPERGVLGELCEAHGAAPLTEALEKAALGRAKSPVSYARAVLGNAQADAGPQGSAGVEGWEDPRAGLEEVLPRDASLWRRVLARAPKTFGGAAIARFLAPLKCRDERADALTLTAPDAYVQRWVTDHYAGWLTEEASALAGHPVTVTVHAPPRAGEGPPLPAEPERIEGGGRGPGPAQAR